ncbi:MAG: AAA family ATPase [Candidatus Pacebacteria bacterium]|nr:AAA family ATPase [Candidatus Paceibacterota bacterium]
MPIFGFDHNRFKRGEITKANIVTAGGPCTGKSTLAAALFARLKIDGYDYDLITEESRHLRKEFGHPRSPFERLYLWRQQEREELRSSAANGFVSDTALFQYYVHARLYASEARDNLAVRELFRMCLEIEDRYQLVVVAQDPCEIPYKKDQSRSLDEGVARERHRMTVSFVEHFWPKKLLSVHGTIEERVSQVLKRMDLMRREQESK